MPRIHGIEISIRGHSPMVGNVLDVIYEVLTLKVNIRVREEAQQAAHDLRLLFDRPVRVERMRRCVDFLDERYGHGKGGTIGDSEAGDDSSIGLDVTREPKLPCVQ